MASPEYWLERIERVDRTVTGRAGLSAIYVLAEPDGNAIRYVGKANNPWRRLSQHQRPGCLRRSRVSAWAGGLLDRKERPVMFVVEWTSDWDEAERRWVSTLTEQGCDLLNVAPGGDHMRAAGYARKGRKGVKPFQVVLSNVGQLASMFDREGKPGRANALREIMRVWRKGRRVIEATMGREGKELFDAELLERFMPHRRASVV